MREIAGFRIGDKVEKDGRMYEVVSFSPGSKYPIFVSQEESDLAGATSPDKISLLQCRDCGGRMLYHDEKQEKFCPFCNHG